MFIGKKKKKRPEQNPVYFSKHKQDKGCMYMLDSRDIIFMCIVQHCIGKDCIIYVRELYPSFDNVQIICTLLKIAMKAAGLTKNIGIYIPEKFVTENFIIAMFQAGFVAMPEFVEVDGEKIMVSAKLAQYKTSKRFSFIKNITTWKTQLSLKMKLKKKNQTTL